MQIILRSRTLKIFHADNLGLVKVWPPKEKNVYFRMEQVFRILHRTWVKEQEHTSTSAFMLTAWEEKCKK